VLLFHKIKAKELYHALRTPSIKDIKLIITMNKIANIPVNMENIALAEQIFREILALSKEKQQQKTKLC
jgi:hypothetical protein